MFGLRRLRQDVIHLQNSIDVLENRVFFVEKGLSSEQGAAIYRAITALTPYAGDISCEELSGTEALVLMAQNAKKLLDKYVFEATLLACDVNRLEAEAAELRRQLGDRLDKAALDKAVHEAIRNFRSTGVK